MMQKIKTQTNSNGNEKTVIANSNKKEPGSSCKWQVGVGFDHGLAPNTVLWLQLMDHGMQIVYSHVATLISFNL